MKTCDVVRDLLPLYIDEACNEGSRELVEEHLKTCKECEREYRLMKDPACVEGKHKDFAAVEEEILKSGKKRIEDGVKQRIMNRLLWLDIFLNVFFLSLGAGIRDLFLHATKLPWYGKFLTYVELNQEVHYNEFMQLTGIILASFVFLVCDVIYLILKKRRQGIWESAFEYLMIMSLFMKLLYAVIMTAVGFLYLYGELVSLCG